MRRATDGRQGELGFTLLEVMVALAIAMAAVSVLYGATAGALHAARTTANLQQAVSRTRSHLAALDNPGVVLGERSGDDGDGFRWQTDVHRAAAVPARKGTKEGPWARGTGLYAVSVTVFWREGRDERHFMQDGAVLGPVAAP